MQVSAAKKIDQGYGRKYETSDEVEEPKAQQNPVRKPYDPYKGKIRRSGTGGIYQINDHLYEGRYSPTNAEGKRERHNVYAKTYEECERKLNEKIQKARAQIEAEKAKCK